MFVDPRRVDRAERLDNCIEEIRRRFGKRAVYAATLMGDIKMPCDGRDLVRMPSALAR